MTTPTALIDWERVAAEWLEHGEESYDVFLREHYPSLVSLPVKASAPPMPEGEPPRRFIARDGSRAVYGVRGNDERLSLFALGVAYPLIFRDEDRARIEGGWQIEWLDPAADSEGKGGK